MFKQNVTVFVGISGATVETPQIFNYFCFQISPYPKTLVLFPSLFSPKFPQIKNLSLLPSTRQTFPKSAASSHSWTVAGLYRHTPLPSEICGKIILFFYFSYVFPSALSFCFFLVSFNCKTNKTGFMQTKMFHLGWSFFSFFFFVLSVRFQFLMFC